MAKSVLIIASDGSEDIELIVTSDVLRRAGVDVTIAGLQDQPQIELARKAKLHVDALFKDVLSEQYAAVVLPGGQPGSNNLAADERVGQVLRRHEAAGAIVAAICAAPIALVAHGVAKGGTLTAYPAVKDKITAGGYTYSEDNVCVYNNVVTSRGPGTAFDFALKLAELLAGAEKAQEVRGALLLLG
uniref:D-lactate dehydratase n=1 Tax=Globodera rostochiensis TaxID=31243 RepID=A0A914HFH0_GLORO